MARKTTLVDVLEAAYAVDRDDETWLRGLVDAVGPLLDQGVGAHAFEFDLSSPRPLGEPRAHGGTAAWKRVWRTNWWEPFLLAFDRRQLRFAVGFGTVSYSTHLWAAGARRIPSYRELFSRLGATGWGKAFGRYAQSPNDGRLFYPDSLNVLAADTSHRGIALIGNRQTVADGPVEPGVRATWERVAGHVAAALRVRERLARVPVEAVIEPNGRVAHAEGGARDRAALAALREAAIRVDRARTRAARGAPDVLDVWQALHAKRWTLVDQFERDGRRYYVARPNQPTVGPNASFERLSERERQVVALLALGRSNKAIAYELGLATSSVSTLLARAAAKTGAGTIASLGALARQAIFDVQPVERDAAASSRRPDTPSFT